MRPDSKGITSQVRNWDSSGFPPNKPVSHYQIKVHIFCPLKDHAIRHNMDPYCEGAGVTQERDDYG